MGKEGAKKVPRWFQKSQLGQGRPQGWTDRLEMVSREPTSAKWVRIRLAVVPRGPSWAKEAPRQAGDGFKGANLGKEGPKDLGQRRLEG